MRCVYMSDLHLEGQDFSWPVPEGDVLIIAGDTCHAACLDPTRADPYAARQRDRVLRLIGQAVANFRHVLMIAGNHEHYDGVFGDTAGLMRAQLPGVTVLDNAMVEVGGVAFFGTTLWSDFEGRSPAAMEAARKGMGEYFFAKTREAKTREAKTREAKTREAKTREAKTREAKTRERDDDGAARLVKLRPEVTLAAHDQALARLVGHLSQRKGKPTVVISHHAPSRKGLNALHMGNGLDGAYASALDDFVAGIDSVPVWVHGHTHVVASYRIGACQVVANCRGLPGDRSGGRGFKPDRSFEI